MLRRQFLQIISDLRAELERSSDPAVGVADYPVLKQKINRIYETLYADYDWPHLVRTFDAIPLQTSQRYYDFPEDLDFDRLVEKPVTWFSNQPVKLERGISLEDYIVYNSEDGVTADPAIKWDVRYDEIGDKEVIEIWPIPASSDNTIQFRGVQKFKSLVDDADVCRLDDHMVVLFAAAELTKDKANKQLFLQAANKRMMQLRGNSQTMSENVRIGLGSKSKFPARSVVRVSG